MNHIRFWLSALVLALMASALTYVITYNHTYDMAMEQTEQAYRPYVEQYEVAKKVTEVGAVLDEYFVGEYDMEEMKDAVASAMVEATGDEWSYYISAEELATYYENLTNSYVGIGVTVTVNEEEGGLLVTDVTRDAPAYFAGILVNDVITKIEGVSTIELGLEESRDRIRGDAGTEVTITIKRNGEEFDLTLTRSSILTEVVTYELMEEGVGYIEIVNFDQRCAEQTIHAIEALIDQGATSLLFDVRFNPGGMKTELCTLLDYLLPAGIIFQSRDVSGAEEIVRSGPSCLRMPMAVLVNVDSYSAAEFFAAALQEYGVATIVGEQTYGKGYYQRTYSLSDGSAIALSSGAYFTPNGVSLAGVGITPDYVVPMDEETYANLYYGLLPAEEDEQIQKAIEVLVGQ